MKISYKQTFIRQFNKLHPTFQEEILEKIEMLRYVRNHQRLKVHKLHGRLANHHSFSVNYRTRIVFTYISKQEIALLAIGEHDVYEN